MTRKSISLAELPLGQTGVVRELKTASHARRRLLDLGLIPNTIVEALYTSPAGDPTAYQIRGTVIALRTEEATGILLDSVSWR